jgi:hypothetical protein
MARIHARQVVEPEGFTPFVSNTHLDRLDTFEIKPSLRVGHKVRLCLPLNLGRHICQRNGGGMQKRGTVVQQLRFELNVDFPKVTGWERLRHRFLGP